MFENQKSSPAKNHENFQSAPALQELVLDCHRRIDSKSSNSGDQPACLPPFKLIGEGSDGAPIADKLPSSANPRVKPADWATDLPPQPSHNGVKPADLPDTGFPPPTKLSPQVRPVDIPNIGLPPLVGPRIVDSHSSDQPGLPQKPAESQELRKPGDFQPEHKLVDHLGLLREKNEKLASELAKSKEFLTDAEKQLLKDRFKEKKDLTGEDLSKFLMSRIREQFDECAKKGISPDKVVEQMNKVLKAEGADFTLVIEDKNDTSFKLSMKDVKTGKTVSRNGMTCSMLVAAEKK